MSGNTTPAGAGARTSMAGSATPANFVVGDANAAAGAATEQSGETNFGEVLAAIQKQSAGQSAVITRLQKELKEMRGLLSGAERGAGDGEDDDAGAPASGKRTSPYKQQLEELKAFQESVRQKETRMLQTATMRELTFGLTAKGLDRKAAGIVAEALRARLGERVVSAENSLGQLMLSVKGESDEDLTPVDQWIDAFLSSDEGKAFVPAQPNPSLRGVPSGRNGATAGKIKITKDELKAGRFDHKALAEGRAVVVD